ncbi:Auxin-responsive protein IAA17 [Dichanthelium oligosanthes]|uniref:Auxin-responsive protein n=1 Tax=Dichanthelium oligosanthes TaxID=888268 RepID=A0A1E5WER6_9POAL|nr:Auxin-responsive protein IAA17 [Dichanthelium oligosanthes]
MSPQLELDYIGLSSPAAAAAADVADDLKGTELRLGLPGSQSPDRRVAAATATTLDLLPAKGAKRGFSDEAPPPSPAAAAGKGKKVADEEEDDKKVAATPQPAANNNAPGVLCRAQVVGWPPIRSYRKNTMATTQLKGSKEDAEAKQGQGFLYVKVSMDGAPYLRKIDLKTYQNYKDLSTALEKMFSGFSTGKDGLSEYRKDGEYVLTYEDKDGDWMLVGDVPWEMFAESCRRLRIMKGSDAIGLAPRAAEKSKNRN